MGPEHEEETGQKRHLIEPERKKRKREVSFSPALPVPPCDVVLHLFFREDTFLLFRRVTPVGNRMHIFSPSGLSPGRGKRKKCSLFLLQICKKRGGVYVGRWDISPFPFPEKALASATFFPPW